MQWEAIDNVHLCVSIWNYDSGSSVKTKVDWRKILRKETRGCWIHQVRKAEGMNFSYNLEVELRGFAHNWMWMMRQSQKSKMPQIPGGSYGMYDEAFINTEKNAIKFCNS